MDNIRVAIRVRPLIQREVSKDAESHWKVEDNTIFQVENGVPVPNNIINPTAFTFDKVYAGADTTEEIYGTFAKPVVLKAMEGVNGTIFAYGQTGTGKTYTMMGLPNNAGVIPRSINDVFDLLNMAPDREYLIRVSYMEIYNELITDLLKMDGANLKVRNNDKNEVFIENLSEVPIASADQALHYLQAGERQRRFGETNMNEKSSRSHTIFRVTIESRLTTKNSDDQYDDNAVTVSQLNLVDLAGSERAAQTGAQGTRLKESGYINKSLLALGTVISKLSSAGEEGGFIPYRDSKLTRILMNSLGGNAMTSIIATVTPAVADETLSTLKFASRAKTIKNKPKVNEVVDGDTMIRRYQKEINKLKKQINEIQATSGINHLKMENEKMELLLEEHIKQRREQTEKITTLQNLIISAQDFQWNKVSKPTRRETWCPGKLKRSLGLARAHEAASQVFRMPQISSDSESDDEDIKSSFFDDKSDFLRDLEKEERKSLEEFKRKRSACSNLAAPKLKFRRSYQSGVKIEHKVDQGCQTEVDILESQNLPTESNSENALLETLQKFKDENTALSTEMEKLQSKIVDLQKNNEMLAEENVKLNTQVGCIQQEKNDSFKDEKTKMLSEIEILKTELESLRESKNNLTVLNNELNEQLQRIENEQEALATDKQTKMLAEIEMLKAELASLHESKDNLVILNNQLNEQLKTMEKKQEVSTKDKQMPTNSPRFANISCRRRVRSLSPGKSPLCLKPLNLKLEETRLEDLGCQTEAFTTSPSISELKANLSLANFEYFEKDIESDEFRIKLEEAIAAIEERDGLIDELKDQIKVITETVEDEKKFITHQNDLFVENECKLREAEKKIKEFVEELDRVKAECSSLSEEKMESDDLLSEAMKELEQVNSELAEIRKFSEEKDILLQNLKAENEKTVSSGDEVKASKEIILGLEESKKATEQHIDEIKKDKEELERTIEIKDELIRKLQAGENEKIASTFEKLEALQEIVDKHEESKAELEQQMKLVEKEKTELEKCIEQKEKVISEMQANVSSGEAEIKFAELELKIVEMEVLNEELQNKLVEKDGNKAENEALVNQIKTLETEIEDLERKAQLSTKTEEEYQANVKQLEEKNAKLKKHMTMISDDLQEAEDVNMNLTEQISVLKQSLEETESVTEELAVISEERRKLEMTIKENSEIISEMQNRINEYEETIESAKEERQQLTADIARIMWKTRDKDREIDELSKKYQHLQDTNNSALDQIETLKLEKQQLSSKVNMLETDKNNEKELHHMLKDLELQNQKLDKDNQIFKNEIAKLEKTCIDTEAENGKVAIALEKCKEELLVLQKAEKSHVEQVASLKTALDEESKQVSLLKDSCTKQRCNIEHLLEERNDRTKNDSLTDKRIAELESVADKYKTLYTESDEERQILIERVGQLSRHIEEQCREDTEKLKIIERLEQERNHACAEVNALKKQKNGSSSEGSFNGTTTNSQDEVKALKIALQQLEKEKIQFEAEIFRLKKENENELKRLTEEKGSCEFQGKDHMNAQLETLKAENLKYQAEIEKLNRICDEDDIESEKLFKTIQENEKQIAHLKSLNASNTNEHRVTVSSLKTELDNEKRQVSGLKDLCMKQKLEIEELLKERKTASNASAVKRIAELESTVNKYETLYAESNEQRQQLIQKVGQLTRQIEEKFRESAEKIKIIEKLKQERDDACAEINALKTQNNCFASDNSFSDRTKNGEDEIKALKIALQQANQEKTQFEAEISRLKDENEKIGEEADEEMQRILDDIYKQQEDRRKVEKQLKEEIRSLQKKLADNEELNRVRDELETTRKDRFDKMCNSVSLEKENQRLLKELDESEKARTVNEQYQENRVASLKNELKRLREEISSSANRGSKDGVNARGVIETTAVFSLKMEKANLEPESNRFKNEVEELSKRNQRLSLEKCDFESKYNALRTECYRLKRGLKGYSQDAGTQTLKEQCCNIEHKTKGTTSHSGTENDRGFLAPDLYPFKEEKDDPAQCTQQ